MYLNAGRLFRDALDSLGSSGSVRDYTASVLFAHISTEAFINELAVLSGLWSQRLNAPKYLGPLADMLDGAEASHASTESKYQLAKFILSGSTFEKGSSPFRDFVMLVKLRNLVVHGKPTDVVIHKDTSGNFKWKEPKFMQQLEQMKIIDPQLVGDVLLQQTATESTFTTNFSHVLGTMSVAGWACNAASGIMTGILDAVPEDVIGFQTTIRGVYSPFHGLGTS